MCSWGFNYISMVVLIKQKFFLLLVTSTLSVRDPPRVRLPRMPKIPRRTKKKSTMTSKRKLLRYRANKPQTHVNMRASAAEQPPPQQQHQKLQQQPPALRLPRPAPPPTTTTTTTTTAAITTTMRN